MTRKLAVFAAVVLTFGCSTPHHGTGEGQLGKVTFANTCRPAVQPDLARAVAILHSFWFSHGEQAFRDVL